ncbi:MAG: type I DNA topoisomerase [Deltaproteobacteria bacterium]|nr:type I DNA topoisomerase [Deltaproteobacteria bacterium]
MPNLLIVESPSKAKTLTKYLGTDFNVVASQGHIKDLPPNDLGVDIENNFKPYYYVIRGKNKIIQRMKELVKKADKVYLGPDPDREGEAIAFHIFEELGVPPERVYRVLFNEITKNAVINSLKHPQKLDINKYQSQQARRILDRLVGYLISPILWKKVMPGLSAGRVQSVAVRLIVDREEEIRRFERKKYYELEGVFFKDNGDRFKAKLVSIGDQKVVIEDKNEAQTRKNHIKQLSYFRVAVVNDIQRKKNPPPPFITSKLQQAAYNAYGFSAKKTMSLAQDLYEGMDIGGGRLEGLVTYIRTDSVRVSEESIRSVREYISKKWGDRYLPENPIYYSAKGRSQDAHEAIRPTHVEYTPDSLRDILPKDHYRLYDLIWKRFVASQMSSAIYLQRTVVIESGAYEFKAVGSKLLFDGYQRVFDMSEENNSRDEESDEVSIPDLNVGDMLRLEDIEIIEKETQPPPRYTEATLIKELEERGIGRPSTYATIISNIQDRKYVEKHNNRFVPTELGFMVTKLLEKAFPDIMNPEFTAMMEDKLDRIEEGEIDYVDMLKKFYSSFEVSLRNAIRNFNNYKDELSVTYVRCDKCESYMNIKINQYGSYLACSNYPKCKNIKAFYRDDRGNVVISKDRIVDGRHCPLCKSELVVKDGRFGEFISCIKYPECNYTEKLTTGVRCPKNCGGELVKRKSVKGKVFYSCTSYPSCKFISSYPIVSHECPRCGNAYMYEKVTKKIGHFLECTDKKCKNRMRLEKEAVSNNE